MVKKSTELMNKVRKDRPYMWERSLKAREIMSRRDQKFLEIYHRNYMYIMHERKALPLKVKEMIIMAVDAIRAHESGLRTHMIQAMKAGATTEEILDALETASLPGGGIVISFAMPIYEEIITNKKLLEQ